MKRVKEVLKSFSRWQYLIDTRNKELATPPPPPIPGGDSKTASTDRTSKRMNCYILLNIPYGFLGQ